MDMTLLSRLPLLILLYGNIASAYLFLLPLPCPVKVGDTRVHGHCDDLDLRGSSPLCSTLHLGILRHRPVDYHRLTTRISLALRLLPLHPEHKGERGIGTATTASASLLTRCNSSPCIPMPLQLALLPSRQADLQCAPHRHPSTSAQLSSAQFMS